LRKMGNGCLEIPSISYAVLRKTTNGCLQI
jgi:hypothetical protein